MPSTKEIRGKIKSVQNTRKITKAMEMVAASKMRKAQDRMFAARPYGDKIRVICSHLARANSEYKHPFLVKHEGTKKIGLILVTTDKGLAVYQIVKDKRIADVEMTGQWETALAKIESGEMNPDTFRKGIEVYAAQITEELLQVQVSVADGGHIPCPKCRSGRILLYPKVAKCSNVDCSLTVFRNKGEKQLTDSQITDLVTKGRTALIKGFRSREDKPFDAYLTFDKEFRIVYGFPPHTDKSKGKEHRR